MLDAGASRSHRWRAQAAAIHRWRSAASVRSPADSVSPSVTVTRIVCFAGRARLASRLINSSVFHREASRVLVLDS